MSKRNKLGFTLVEVLIVVVIMAVLAATIIPQFSDSAKDAKENTALFNLHTLRSQIELYKVNHDGLVPGDDLAELLTRTDSAGNTAGASDDAADFPYGPYLREVPVNSINNKATVAEVTTDPTSGDGSDGWIYNTETGGIWLDDATFFAR